MREPVHDSLIRVRANLALIEKVKQLARAEHKTPSEFIRNVLHERLREAA